MPITIYQQKRGVYIPLLSGVNEIAHCPMILAGYVGATLARVSHNYEQKGKIKCITKFRRGDQTH